MLFSFSGGLSYIRRINNNSSILFYATSRGYGNSTFIKTSHTKSSVVATAIGASYLKTLYRKNKFFINGAIGGGFSYVNLHLGELNEQGVRNSYKRQGIIVPNGATTKTLPVTDYFSLGIGLSLSTDFGWNVDKINTLVLTVRLFTGINGMFYNGVHPGGMVSSSFLFGHRIKVSDSFNLFYKLSINHFYMETAQKGKFVFDNFTNLFIGFSLGTGYAF